ncbi:hypothetical protein ACQ7HM_00480 [Williamsia sp. MIQD14]|uniref:hypothetical protein n=1 Tax=Williamsia sp. MIQD14 TaxID=3425703 RepID=UPI003DA029AE
MTTAQRIRPTCTSDVALSARGVVVVPVDDVGAPCHEAIVRARCFGRMVRAVHVCPAGHDHPELRRCWQTEHPLVDLVIIDAEPHERAATLIAEWVSVMSAVDDLLVVLADGPTNGDAHALSTDLARALEAALVTSPRVLVAHLHAGRPGGPAEAYDPTRG